MRVKICGITRTEDALEAAELGAAAVGFIFFRESPRYIAPEDAARIIGTLPPFVTPVGVFVNETRRAVSRAIELSGVRSLQFHGEESPEDTRGYSLPVVKSFRVGDDFDPADIARYSLPAYLLDSSVSGMYGGTGKTFDWRKAGEAARFGRIILGGGITPENAAEAVRAVHPYAIDVSSGVETSPGIKDRERMRALFESLRTI